MLGGNSPSRLLGTLRRAGGGVPLGQLGIQPPDEPPSERFALAPTVVSRGTSSLVALVAVALTLEPSLLPVQEVCDVSNTAGIEAGVSVLWIDSFMTAWQRRPLLLLALARA